MQATIGIVGLLDDFLAILFYVLILVNMIFSASSSSSKMKQGVVSLRCESF